jgi:hypothetical protein
LLIDRFLKSRLAELVEEEETEIGKLRGAEVLKVG